MIQKAVLFAVATVLAACATSEPEYVSIAARNSIIYTPLKTEIKQRKDPYKGHVSEFRSYRNRGTSHSN